MNMTSDYLVNIHKGPAALSAQTLLNTQYLAISGGAPLILRNTKTLVAVPTTARRVAAANLKYYKVGFKEPVESEHDGIVYQARTPLLRISMGRDTALAVDSTDWDASSEYGWHDRPGVRWLALDGDVGKYRLIATLIQKLKQLP